MNLLMVGDAALRTGLRHLICPPDTCSAPSDLAAPPSRSRAGEQRQRDALAGPRVARRGVDYAAMGSLSNWR